jgi:hypothetical protein
MGVREPLGTVISAAGRFRFGQGRTAGWWDACDSRSGAAAVAEHPQGGAEPSFFLGGRFAPDEKRRHAWNAHRQNSKMLCRQLRIAQCNGAPIRISLQYLANKVTCPICGL